MGVHPTHEGAAPVSPRTQPIARFDDRFSESEAEAVSWEDTARLLRDAELYWLTTVRGDGRPHITPLVGVWQEDAWHFCTGPQEQKARNLAANAEVAVATGTNSWAAGTDVVIEGEAVRLTEQADLQRLADGYLAKYGDDWRFEVGDGVFGSGDDAAYVFRVVPAKVLAFAKQPHGQTSYRFTAG
jgi:general stress protein 26